MAKFLHNLHTRCRLKILQGKPKKIHQHYFNILVGSPQR